MSARTPNLFQRLRDHLRGAARVDQPHIMASSRSARSGGSGRTPLDSAAILARYDAGQMGGVDRSWLPSYVQDARQDISPGERLEMVRKARYFEQNNATMQKSLDLIEVNVVGTGINPTPSSSDPVWNAKALARWEEWSKFADLTSRQSFATLQALMARAQAVDGEIFVWLTYGDPDEAGRRFPRIMLIETHRVCDAKLPAKYDAEGYVQYDGILCDARGRPVFYIVSNDNDAFSKASPKSVALIPAEEMVHVYEPSRTSQPRGITLYHACLHDLHDLDDLQKYEMLASKDAASRANVVYTENGELTDDGTVIGKTEPARTPEGGLAEKVTYYQTAFGARTTVMKRGDKWEQGQALRPTTAQQEFWRILERKFCRGVGHSYAALCDYEGNWGGPALRGAITSDNRFYDVRTKTLTVSFQRVWEHVIGADVKPGGVLYPAPANWRNVVWQPPRRGTVDVGRESKAVIEEVRAGLRTRRDVIGETGRDAREVTRQAIREVSEILSEAQDAKLISIEQAQKIGSAVVLQLVSAGATTPSAPAESAPDDEPAPIPQSAAA